MTEYPKANAYKMDALFAYPNETQKIWVVRENAALDQNKHSPTKNSWTLRFLNLRTIISEELNLFTNQIL